MNSWCCAGESSPSQKSAPTHKLLKGTVRAVQAKEIHMSEQPPWQGFPGPGDQGQAPEPGASQPTQNQQQNGWPQQDPQQYGQQPQYGQPQPAAQQQFGQPHYTQPGYGQSQYGQPQNFMPPTGPRKKTALPWILAGSGVVALAAIVGVVVLVMGMLGGGNKANMVAAPITSASFQYPEGWIRNNENVTIINEDGSQPAEHFNAINKSKDATALVAYKAGAPAPSDVPAETINAAVHKAIDAGLAAQLASSQEELIYMRTSSGFGCLENFAYTEKPAIVERDGLYGYSYGYTCASYQGNVTGEYFVVYDSAGASHRLTVEALDAEWAKNKATLPAIVDSFKPVN